jgi:hypothetical protein
MPSPIQAHSNQIDPSMLQPEEALPTTLAPDEELSDSPFAKMFSEGATRKEVNKFIEQSLFMIALEIKRSTERWKKAQARLKKVAEGKRPDD